ncbi:peptidoglycan-binding protein [Dermabacter sp. p3-SID358]|uniref:C40 family peptidase n=1 Tax=Dermabacter sp. p3-SID358 TaxID=2916114 RepID=UPI0021A3429F|nr:peptidoglycan-binding protein [Dermabacter sp. p3-SID358]MCT1866914.1 peptidoglycan-binding protein [Dermabacter sp. p3-SID358]
MLRTAQRGTHRAEGPAVIDYSSLLAPVSKGAVGAAALTAVAATAATGLGLAPADAATSTQRGPVSQASSKLPPISALGSSPLRTGHSGQRVQALQSLLNHHGANINVDGSFGRRTRNAVVTFQSSAGIGVDGVVGARTRSALGSKNPTAVNSTPKLRPGSRGEAVKNLQSLLNNAGANIKVDGVFGRGTNTAVRNFQSSAGVGVDGVVGPRTWGKLSSGAGSAAASKSSTAVSNTPKLRRGNRGDAVKNLQNLLNNSGANIKADGVFGRATYNAVRNFQSSAGVGVDGVVGPRTWGKLNSGNVTIAKASSANTSAPAPASSTSAKSDASGEAIVESAKKYLGTPYVWGGSSRSGFDCSGLTSTVYREHGISIPRTARKQAFGGKIISESEARVGDLVVFTQRNYGHVGIYAGNGKIVDASRSRNQVVYRDIWTSKVVFVTYR